MACSQATTPPETNTSYGDCRDDDRQQVLQRVEPVIVAALGQAERRKHHDAHSGAEEAAIDRSRKLDGQAGESSQA